MNIVAIFSLLYTILRRKISLYACTFHVFHFEQNSTSEHKIRLVISRNFTSELPHSFTESNFQNSYPNKTSHCQHLDPVLHKSTSANRDISFHGDLSQSVDDVKPASRKTWQDEEEKSAYRVVVSWRRGFITRRRDANGDAKGLRKMENDGVALGIQPDYWKWKIFSDEAGIPLNAEANVGTRCQTARARRQHIYDVSGIVLVKLRSWKGCRQPHAVDCK